MVILLDIDGVMVPASTWKRPEFESDGFPKFSPRAAKSLQQILSETAAGIVLTTSHKDNYTIAQWEQMFAVRGFSELAIQKLAPNDTRLNRKEEVLRWLSQNSTQKRFVIIDDDKVLNSLPLSLRPRLVQTSATLGLTPELAEAAIDILNGPEFIPSETLEG
ncbi:HAD domain-containing protein [Flavimarina sp. Hel_I_48]|uniref:HAD domain-containing protein n=1 Tax=Flavimarina sp. Hel_I_48 TaxID=1392488 RepID=UPI0006919BE8|nr:HAD domain-containing protein [Flavimarina sp. Hel_I_48]